MVLPDTKATYKQISKGSARIQTGYADSAFYVLPEKLSLLSLLPYLPRGIGVYG
jgi:hypothetical protein